MLLTLLSLCLLLLGEVQAAQQQCRLVTPQEAAASLGAPPTAVSPVSNQTTNGSPTTNSNGGQGGGSGSSSSSSSIPSPTPFNYGSTPIRGVNLGGWFVLEPWITPSLFNSFNNTNIVDEFTLGQMMDHDTVLAILQDHWSTWITEDDFEAIAAAGLNHVRMQIGYWSIPITSADTNHTTNVDPYVPGAWPYLLQALNWAKTHNLHVILDLHGAPGSQNGYDNSGQRTGNPQWGSNPDNVPRTLDMIKFMAEKIGGMIDVLELVNEPGAFDPSIGDILRGYWQDGYQTVRDAAGAGLKVMIMDGFLGVSAWQDFLTYPDAQGVLMDTHEYQVFNYDQLQLTWPQHIDYSCQVLTNLSEFASSNIYTIIGEWSTAPTDCAQWLNGRGVGARWDGSFKPDGSSDPTFGSCDGMTGDMSTFSDDYKAFLRQYYEAQVAIGEAIQGWVYWTWKAENADDWSYQRGLQGGWIPQNPSDRMYPNICSNGSST